MNLPNWAITTIIVVLIVTTILTSYKLSQFRQLIHKATKDLAQAAKDLK